MINTNTKSWWHDVVTNLIARMKQEKPFLFLNLKNNFNNKHAAMIIDPS